MVSFLHGPDRLRDGAGAERLHGVKRLDMALSIELNGAAQQAVLCQHGQAWQSHLGRLCAGQNFSNFEELLVTYLSVTSGLSSPRCDKSKPTKVRFDKNPSIASFPWPTKSRRPISTNVPHSATQFHEACRSSPDKALRTTSTPLPSVAFLTPGRKLASRELNILWCGMPKLAMRKSTFSWVPTVQ